MMNTQDYINFTVQEKLESVTFRRSILHNDVALVVRKLGVNDKQSIEGMLKDAARKTKK